MSPRFALLALAATLCLGIAAPAADAGERRTRSKVVVLQDGAHPSSGYYRRGPKVRGYAARRGGYSYRAEDTINTYGDSRSIFGGANAYRNPNYDRQTSSGPFDHGFFFDSGVTLRGGESPYMN